MIRPTDCLLVMGRRGCGKSFLAKRLQDLWPRRVIIDPLNEYSEGRISRNFEEFSQELLKLKSENSKEFILIFQSDPENDMSEAEFNEILRLCYYFGNIQVVIEEIQIFSTPHFLPYWLKQCLHIGRHQGISLLFTTQRPGALHKTILSQCAHIFCGTIVDGNDIRYISTVFLEYSKELPILPDREFLYFSRNGISKITNNFEKSKLKNKIEKINRP